MTDIAQDESNEMAKRRSATVSPYQTEAFRNRLKARYASEARFKIFGILAIAAATLILIVLLTSIISKGYTAFWQTEVKLDIFFDPEVIDPYGDRDQMTLSTADYQELVRQSLNQMFPEAETPEEQAVVHDLVSGGATYELREQVMADPDLIGTTQTVWLSANDNVDQFVKGNIPCGVSHEERLDGASCTIPEDQRKVKNDHIPYIDQMLADGTMVQNFNHILFSEGDSQEPEMAGIWGSIVGSLFTLLVTALLAVPVGVAAAVYLEEFAPKNRLTDFIEVNINNLAAVPSIVFGLLGLAVFLNFFGLPRSAPVTGGVVLALMTLPTVIIATRSALKAVPPSIREAALGIGASPYQVILHHVLPLAAPGILTGTIIGMAQALGETAPLLMIGMVAFIADIPGGFTDPATVMPVQIYMWADSAERAFVERTSAAIMVLLGFLIMMNALAIYLRKKFERRW